MITNSRVVTKTKPIMPLIEIKHISNYAFLTAVQGQDRFFIYYNSHDGSWDAVDTGGELQESSSDLETLLMGFDSVIHHESIANVIGMLRGED